MTEVGVPVELEVKKIEENFRTVEGESNQANDWYPDSYQVSTGWTVYFTNGHSKNYSSIDAIKILD